MKKLVVILVTLIYGLSSTGAIVNLDYCCGKLANISLLPVEKDDCQDGCMKANNCCDSKQILLKVNGEQEIAAKWVIAQKQSPTAIAIAPGSIDGAFILRTTERFSASPPARALQIPLFIQQCVFKV